ncbi:MAG: Single-stranded DNA-binding protein [Anaerolineae bacterium]|nr:MAG: Single-stranded DNA-binding protein [Anaerolineae bacterium]
MLELTVIGNLGKDPEARYTSSGKLVCNFSVASTRKVNGEDQTMWVEVCAWDKLGETCHQYLSKGSKVFVRGYPEVQAFTRRDGEIGAALKVTAQTVQFLSGKAGGVSDSDIKNDEDDEAPF